MKVVPTDRLSLEQLQRYAAAFDEMSDETGARFAAAAFVEWLRLETSGPPRREPYAVRQPSLPAAQGTVATFVAQWLYAGGRRGTQVDGFEHESRALSTLTENF